MSDFENILVAIDFSPESRAAVACALRLGGPTASLTVLHVYEPPNAMEGIVPGAALDADAENQRAELRLEMEAIIGKVNGSSRIQIILEEGPVVAAIVKRATIGKFDAIVMGTHGRTGMRHLLMGSIAAGVSQQAICRVITVHLPS